MIKRTFALIVLLATAGCSGSGSTGKSTFSPLERALAHPIVSNRPAVDFFEGAVLGNGGLGAIVTTRPDAVVIRFGHNNVWDIRIAEDNADKIGTFPELFRKVAAIPDTVGNLEDIPWYRDYLAVMRENYAKPYPRPFPCGSAILHFDRRDAELLGHTLDIARGLCTVDFLIGGTIRHLELFADMERDRLWARMVDDSGKPVPGPFTYIRLLPDPDTPTAFPAWTGIVDTGGASLFFRQVLPSQEITRPGTWTPHPDDRAFTLTAAVSSGLPTKNLSGTDDYTDIGIIPSGAVNGPSTTLDKTRLFALCIGLDEGLSSSIPETPMHESPPDAKAWDSASTASRQIWEQFWSRSGVALDDELLERTWYHNCYFLRCSLRPGVTCPGLFANWSYRSIGTTWHGDYHMNYNTQQPFWATFSTNHLDLHLPYVDMVEKTILPLSKSWAANYYGLRGAFFPHSAYPVTMTIMPYPLPTWGWEVFETPWTVQSLWWHYRYTRDRDFLEKRTFPVIREAVLFLVDYMMRPEAREGRFGDGLYHIFPSVPPELYGLRPGFEKNYDTQADLTLTKFVFNAYLDAVKILGIEDSLAGDVREILAHYPDYPTAPAPGGDVFVSVPGETPGVVYNVPASLMTVFPGEEHGLHSPKDTYDLAVRTYRFQENEGGNDLVFLNLQASRLGVLDLERFKRQIHYSLLPNGTCTDKVLQTHGRYTDTTPFDFMAPMGLWFENFGLPAVIDECLLQSYTGELRFFPNWPADKTAEFRTLRADGAFLVSARWENAGVSWIEITSEAGGTLRILSPWPEGATVEVAGKKSRMTGEIITVETQPGDTVILIPSR